MPDTRVREALSRCMRVGSCLGLQQVMFIWPVTAATPSAKLYCKCDIILISKHHYLFDKEMRTSTTLAPAAGAASC
jgi:hypothetical protein